MATPKDLYGGQEPVENINNSYQTLADANKNIPVKQEISETVVTPELPKVEMVQAPKVEQPKVEVTKTTTTTKPILTNYQDPILQKAIQTSGLETVIQRMDSQGMQYNRDALYRLYGPTTAEQGNITEQQKKDKALNYDKYTTDQIKNMTIGDKELEAIQKYNPNKYKEIINSKKQDANLSIINAGNPEYGKMIEENKKATDTGLETVYKTLDGLVKGMADMGLAPTTNIGQIRTDLEKQYGLDTATANYNNDYAEFKNQENIFKNIENDIENELKTSGGAYTSSYLAAKVAKRQKELMPSYQRALTSLELSQNNLNTIKSNVTDALNTQIKQLEIDAQARQEARQAIQDRLTMFNMQYGIYKDQQARQDDFDKLYLNQDFQKQAEERAWDRAIKQFDMERGNIDSTDTRAQKTGILNTVQGIIDNFKSMGVPMQRSAEQMTNDIINGLKAEGKAINSANVNAMVQGNIIEQVKTKPEYLNWIKKNSGDNLDNYMSYDYTDADGNKQQAFINKYTKEVWQPGTSNPIINTSNYQNYMGKQEGERGGQCGTFVNNVLGTKIFGNSLDDKKSQINSTTPIEGGIVIMNSKKFPKNGHVAVIEKVNPDGTLNIKESNWGGDERIHTRTISQNDENILGYYTKPTQSENKYTNIAKQINDGAIKVENLKTLGYKTTEIDKILQEKDRLIEEGYKKPIDTNTKNQITDILSAINDLKKTAGFEGAVGASTQKYLPGWIKPGEGEFIPGTEAATYAAKFNRLRDLLTLPNLDKLKGAMSDKDIQFIRNSATALSLDMTEDEFKKTVDDIANKYNNLLSGGIKTQLSTEDNINLGNLFMGGLDAGANYFSKFLDNNKNDLFNKYK